MRNSRLWKRVISMSLVAILCLTALFQTLNLGIFASREELTLSIDEILAAVERNGGSTDPFYLETRASSSGIATVPNTVVYSTGDVPVVTVMDESGAVLDTYEAPELGDWASYELQDQVEAFVSGLDAPYNTNADLLSALEGQLFVKEYGGQAIVVIDPYSYVLTFLAVNTGGSEKTYTLTITGEYGELIELSSVSAIVRAAVAEELDESALASYMAAGVDVDILSVTETVSETESESIFTPSPQPQEPSEDEREESSSESGDNASSQGSDNGEEPGDENTDDKDDDADKDTDTDTDTGSEAGDNNADGNDAGSNNDRDNNDNDRDDSDRNENNDSGSNDAANDRSSDAGDSSGDMLPMMISLSETPEMVEIVQSDESSAPEEREELDNNAEESAAEPNESEGSSEAEQPGGEEPTEDSDENAEEPKDDESKEPGDDENSDQDFLQDETVSDSEELIVRSYAATVTHSQEGAVRQSGTAITLTVGAGMWGETTFGVGLDNLRFEVTFNPNNGQDIFTRSTGPDDKVTEPELPDLPTGMRTFMGWYQDGATEPFNFDVALTEDIVLTAQYSAQVYVRFKDCEGKVILTQMVDYGGYIIDPNFSDDQLAMPAGNMFKYWYSENQVVQPGERPEEFVLTSRLYEPVTLLPHTDNSYYVTFVSYGSAVEPQTVSAGGRATAPATAPTRPGYEFVCWSSNPNATGIGDSFNFNTTINNNLTLYGVWRATMVDYTVVYWVEKPDLPMDFNKDDRNNYMYAASDHMTAAVLAGSTMNAPQASSAFINDLADTNALRFSSYYAGLSDQNKTIAGDGTTVLNAYYTREVYTLTFDPRIDITLHPTLYPTMHYNGQSYDLSLGQNYVLEAKYEMDISGLFPTQTDASLSFDGTYSASADRNHVFYGWLGQGFSTIWVTKRWVFTSDMIPDDGSKSYTLAGMWIMESSVRNNEAVYLLEVVDQSNPPAGAVSYTHTDGVTRWYLKDDELSQGYVSDSLTLNPKGLDGFVNIARQSENLSPTSVRTTFHYNRLTYDLTFDLKGGTISGQTFYEALPYQTPIEPLVPQSEPTREEYKFAGWYTNAEGDGDPFVFTDATMPNENLVLFAVWEPAEFSVKFYETKGGTLLAEYGVARYASVQIPTAVADYVPGYSHPVHGEFRAWLWNVGGASVAFDFDAYVVEKDVELYGAWNTVGFQLEYDLGAYSHLGAAPVDNSEYDYGVLAIVKELGNITIPAPMAFVGWQINATGTTYYPGAPVMVYGPLTLVAKYVNTNTETVINLTYYANYTGSNETITYPAVSGESTALLGNVAFTRQGYELVGWSDSPGDNNSVDYALGELITPTGDREFYAVWERVTRTVTFVAGEGGTLTGQTVFNDILVGTEWGSAGIVVPGKAPVSDDYYFIGWEPQLPADDYPILTDLTFTAVFKPHPVLGVSDIDFGTRDVPRQTTHYDKRDELIVTVKDPYAYDWDLTLSCTQQFTLQLGSQTYTLPYEALYFLMDDNDQYNPNGSNILHNGSFLVVHESTGDNDDVVTLRWKTNTGLMAVAAPGEVLKEGTYEAVLQWTIRGATP